MSISLVIVTYQPNIETLSSLVLGNLDYLNQIIIVDNASHNAEEIFNLSENNKKIKLISLSENLGIATAQNIGINSLQVDRNEIIIFFDQDSSIGSQFLDAVEKEHEILSSSRLDNIVLGPNFYNTKLKFEYPCVVFNKCGLRKKVFPSKVNARLEVSCVISSGMSVKKKTLDMVGGMKDELFIDYVDTEWCMRAKRLGCKVYVSPNIKMFHEIGDNNLKFLNWRIPVHSAHRRYYRIRNSFLLLNFPYFPKLAALREISFNIIHQLVLLIFCKHRVELFKSLVFGVRDGFLSFIKNK